MPFKQPGIYTNDTAITEHRSKDMTSEDSFSFNSYKRPECIIVSNRGPLEYYVDDDGSYRTRHGSGGLVTALLGAIQRRYVVWIALTMTETDQLGMQASSDTSASLPPALADMTLQLLSLPQQTYEQYYYHISNNVLWPAQHALLDPVIHTAFTQHTRDAWEQGYCKANNIVADAIIRVLKKWGTDVPVIIQDYQLYLVAEQVRAQCPEARLSHVIYIPWPDARYLAMLPKYMAQAIYHSLMMNDIIGFQTWHDARNFISGAMRFLRDVQIIENSENRPGILLWQGRTVYTEVYPAVLSPEYILSVAQSYDAEASGRSVQLQDYMEKHQKIILRVDRVEPTKNIIRGFQAYENLLQSHPELHECVTFLALLTPSREGLAAYNAYESQVKEMIAHINTRFGQPHWQPIVAVFGNDRARALVCLQYFDVLLVNPVIDGMNLVVKEGGLLNTRSGAIVLSRTAGAYDTLGEHVLSIAPLDIEDTTNALYQALTMSIEERKDRADRTREILLKEDATAWFEMQINALRDK
jgi:trehalose 6-phosphate synthase